MNVTCQDNHKTLVYENINRKPAQYFKNNYCVLCWFF